MNSHFRRSGLLAALFALLVMVGCGSGARPFAAIVNGERLAVNDLEDELEAIKGNTVYLRAIEQATGQPVLGESESTFSAAFTAQVVNRMILFELVRQELDKRGAKVEKADLDEARTSIVGQLSITDEQGQPIEGEKVLAAFDQAFQDLLIERTASVVVLQQALAEDVPTGPDAAREYYDAHRDEFEQVCAHHILVKTREAAVAVRQRILDGESFEAIAKKESDDPGSGAQGGDLGCQPRGVYVPEFETAAFSQEVGELGQPVQTSFGFHVIRVDKRETPTFEDIQAEVEARVAQAGQTSFDDWLTKAIDGAEIEVNARFGRWSTEFQPQVVPPEVPTTLAPKGATTTVPSPFGLPGQ